MTGLEISKLDANRSAFKRLSLCLCAFVLAVANNAVRADNWLGRLAIVWNDNLSTAGWAERPLAYHVESRFDFRRA